uniref:Uncharacterized protein n=1 Tax=Magallana gigas TaxID=29159 RepID=A0A8W8NZE9_MAGGI
MATADLERELTALHEEIRELEKSIRQQGNVMHSTPRPREMEIRNNYDSGIASGRPSSIIPRSPLADHFPDVRPDSQLDHTRPKVRFNEEMDTRDETNGNGIGPVVNNVRVQAVELGTHLRAEDKRGYRAYQHQLMTDTTAGEESVKIELKDWMASIEKNVADTTAQKGRRPV